MGMEITLVVKSVYGNDLIYPACWTSEKLLKLKKSKTFTPEDLDVFKSVGIDIVWDGEPYPGWKKSYDDESVYIYCPIDESLARSRNDY